MARMQLDATLTMRVMSALIVSITATSRALAAKRKGEALPAGVTREAQNAKLAINALGTGAKMMQRIAPPPPSLQ